MQKIDLDQLVLSLDVHEKAILLSKLISSLANTPFVVELAKHGEMELGLSGMAQVYDELIDDTVNTMPNIERIHDKPAYLDRPVEIISTIPEPPPISPRPKLEDEFVDLTYADPSIVELTDLLDFDKDKTPYDELNLKMIQLQTLLLDIYEKIAKEQIKNPPEIQEHVVALLDKAKELAIHNYTVTNNWGLLNQATAVQDAAYLMLDPNKPYLRGEPTQEG